MDGFTFGELLCHLSIDSKCPQQLKCEDFLCNAVQKSCISDRHSGALGLGKQHKESTVLFVSDNLKEALLMHDMHIYKKRGIHLQDLSHIF